MSAVSAVKRSTRDNNATATPPATDGSEEVNAELITDVESRQLTEDIIMGRADALGGAVEDPANAQEQIVRRILQAPDEDSVLAEDKTIATKELVGVPIEIQSFRILRSKLMDPDTGEVKQGVWMIIDAKQLDDEAEAIIAVNTGAPKIMAQLIRLQQLERIPAKVKVAEVGQAKPGQNRALQLIAA